MEMQLSTAMREYLAEIYRLQEDWSWRRADISEAAFWGLAAPEAQTGPPPSPPVPSPDGES